MHPLSHGQADDDFNKIEQELRNITFALAALSVQDKPERISMGYLLSYEMTASREIAVPGTSHEDRYSWVMRRAACNKLMAELILSEIRTKEELDEQAKKDKLNTGGDQTAPAGE